MIIITLAGESSRFFESGYSIVKYKLLISNVTIIEQILSYISSDEKIVIVVNKKFGDLEYFNELLKKRFHLFRIVEIEKSRGQLDSVYQALINTTDFYSQNERLIIYNGDTIRRLPYEYTNYDGAIECFIQEGNHWSFVDNIGFVNNVVEKQRISNYCSTGLYEFKSPSLILDYYNEYCVDGEFYIAPYYSFLLEKGFVIVSYLSQCEDFILCGTPVEYENSKREIENG
jgi:dTDP-glucose pyrophosphorylase